MQGSSEWSVHTMPSRVEQLTAALDLVGDRWTLAVVDALLEGHHRFGELQQRLPGLAPNILTGRLRQLEEQGLAISRAYQERPPRFAYEPTERARALRGVIDALVTWAAEEVAPEDTEPVWL
jgi:DNA-binding HxlR family transcriptional regulator